MRLGCLKPVQTNERWKTGKKQEEATPQWPCIEKSISGELVVKEGAEDNECEPLVGVSGQRGSRAPRRVRAILFVRVGKAVDITGKADRCPEWYSHPVLKDTALKSSIDRGFDLIEDYLFNNSPVSWAQVDVGIVLFPELICPCSQ
jgi:hypothetical protein